MPTYDYECSACGHQFEFFQGITEEPIKVCPQCKKRKIRRLIGTGAGLLFKGSGFYITDYRSDGYKKAQKADSSSPASSPAPAASEGKPASTKAASTKTSSKKDG
jgi:putative FmdB family regulatory protein